MSWEVTCVNGDLQRDNLTEREAKVLQASHQRENPSHTVKAYSAPR